MKHILHIAAVSAAIISASCNKPATDATTHRGMTLRAATENTSRTDFDGTATTWAEGDAMTVLISRAGETPQAHKFTVTDPSDGTFSNDGIATDPDAAYDIHAVYPYNPDKTAIGTDNALFDIGSAAQTQHGASASHVAAFDPLIGSAAGSSPDNAALIMHHTATLIRLRLHNATKEALQGITSATITAPDETVIAARHAIDLADGTTSADAPTSSPQIEVTVESSGAVPDGGEFSVWAAAAPFTVESGQSLRIDISTAEGKTYSVTKRFDEPKAFPAGTIMATDIELSNANEFVTLTVDFTDAASYPDDFPSSDAAVPTTHEYLFAGRTFAFYCPDAYYYYEYGDYRYLAIGGIGRQTGADIGLPVIEGYAPTRIVLGMHESCKSRKFLISVTDPDGNILEGINEQTPYNLTNIYEPTSTDDAKQYRIHIGFNGTQNVNLFAVTSLAVTYSPV